MVIITIDGKKIEPEDVELSEEIIEIIVACLD